MANPEQTVKPVAGHKSNGYFSVNRSEMLAYLPPGSRRILEIGCGAGAFAKLIRQAFGQSPKIEIEGIEIDPAAALQAEVWMDRVYQGPVQSILPTLPLLHYDTIVFNDVLEHLVEPSSVLSEVSKHLAPGGHVVASVPNVRHIGNLFNLLIKKDWNYTESGILDKTHLRFYTKKSLIRLFLDSGYEVELVEGINPTQKRFLFVLDFLMLGYWRDTLYFQFAIRAKRKESYLSSSSSSSR